MKITSIVIKILKTMFVVLKFGFKLSYYFSLPFIKIGRHINKIDRERSRLIENEYIERRMAYAAGRGLGAGMIHAQQIERRRRGEFRRARRAFFGS